MKIAVMAAGGLGGYYGALLAKDGHDVTFIARGAHLKAIRENGLTIKRNQLWFNLWHQGALGQAHRHLTISRQDATAQTG